MNVLLVGASGITGLAVMKEMASRGHHLRCVDPAPPKYGIPDSLAYLGYDPTPPAAEWVYKDILGEGVAETVVQDMDACAYVALAYPTSDKDDLQYPINIGGPERIVRAGLNARLRRFIYASTTSISLGPDEPHAEEDPPHLYGSYTTSKWLAEEYLRHCSKHLGLAAVCLRLGTVRPHFRDSRYRERLIQVNIDVRDVARAFRLALEAEAVRFDVLHIVSKGERVACTYTRAKEVLGFEAQYVGREHFLGLIQRQAEFHLSHPT